jgi:hypothetical protein
MINRTCLLLAALLVFIVFIVLVTVGLSHHQIGDNDSYSEPGSEEDSVVASLRNIANSSDGGFSPKEKAALEEVT